MDTALSPSTYRPAEGSSAQSSVDRVLVTSRPASQRSRVTNGSKLVAGLDGRSAEARRYRDLQLSYADDAGGADSLTEAQRALIAQAADLTIQSERLRGAMLRGEAVDVEQQSRVAKAKGGPQAPALSEADISLQKRLVDRLEEVETESKSSLASAKRAVAAGVSGVVAARVADNLVAGIRAELTG
jgi:hypothetical protein